MYRQLLLQTAWQLAWHECNHVCITIFTHVYVFHFNVFPKQEAQAAKCAATSKWKHPYPIERPKWKSCTKSHYRTAYAQSLD